MINEHINKPDFIIIGAQKAGTSWLWKTLDGHPDVDMPDRKEIHFFGGIEIYRKGIDWYNGLFAGLDPKKMHGEASTTYFFDYMPYWHNPGSRIEYDPSLPSIPRLILNSFPDVKIIVSLRDPVARALSAHRHNIKSGRIEKPLSGIEAAVKRRPKMRILEYGDYQKYLTKWMEFISAENLLILLFEDDIKRNPVATVKKVYDFLGLDTKYFPEIIGKKANKSWSVTRGIMQQYSKGLLRKKLQGRLGDVFERMDFFKPFVVRRSDISFLRERYLPHREEIEALIGRDLSSWQYGKNLLK